MAAVKKGFVVYFNNYPLMASLPLEQRGLLFSVLMVYADRVWRDSAVTIEEVMEGFPQLTPETRMACGFMGAAIRQDTQAWLSKREHRAKSNQGRMRRLPGRTGGPGRTWSGSGGCWSSQPKATSRIIITRNPAITPRVPEWPP